MEKEGRFETIRKIPNNKGFQFGVGYLRKNLNNVPLKAVLQFFYPDKYYLVETDHVPSEVKVYEFKEGKIKLLRTFSGYDTTEIRNRFRLCKGGVVIREGKKVRVYAFPDLKEIKFKKL